MIQHFATRAAAAQALDVVAARVAPHLRTVQKGPILYTAVYMQEADIDLVQGVPNHPNGIYDAIESDVGLYLIPNSTIGMFPKDTFILQPGFSNSLGPVVRMVKEQEYSEKILALPEVVQKPIPSYKAVQAWCATQGNIKLRTINGYQIIHSPDERLLVAFKLCWL